MFNKPIGEIIPIADRNGQQAVNARHLYLWLGIKKQFTQWMETQIKRCDLSENVDYEVFNQEVKNPSGGRPSTDYALSLNAAKEISMMSQTEKGKQARRYFIECERIAKQKYTPALPTTYKEALTQLLASVEQNEKLQLENEKLQGDVRTQQTINSVLSAEVEELQPKGRIYDKVMNSNENSLSTTSSVANEIGMSGQKLNKMLMACGVIYKAPNGEYLFTSDYRRWNLGRSVSVTIGEETCRIKTYIKWNTRGRAYIHALNDTNWDKRRAWHLLKEGKERVCIND